MEIGLAGGRLGRVRTRPGIGEQQAFGDALGLGFDVGIALDRQQVGLGVEEALDALAEGAPVVPLDGELAAEIEQGALAHLVPDALGADEAEGEVILAVTGAGASAADEHTPTGARGGQEVKPYPYFMVLHSGFRAASAGKSTT